MSLPARRFEQASFRVQENDVDNEERREQNADRPEHVAKEGRHLDAAFAHDAHAHQIGSIADVSHCAHEHSAHGNGHQRVCVRSHHLNGITAREVEEGQIGRRIVKEGRQRAGEPEEHHVVEFAVFVRHERDERSECTFVTGTQHFEHRHDAQEDAEKELGNFLDRFPGELVGFAGTLGGGQHGQDGNDNEDRIAQQALSGQVHTQNIDFNVGLPDAAHQHGTDDNGQIDQIDATVDTKGLLFDRIGIKRAFGHFLLKEVGVNGKINREQNRERHQKRQDQMLRRPEERHSAQEAQAEDAQVREAEDYHHRAGDDALATAKIFIELIKAKKCLPKA